MEKQGKVILVDDLVNRDVLCHARPDARIVPAGKRDGCESTLQAFIEKLLIGEVVRGASVACSCASENVVSHSA